MKFWIARDKNGELNLFEDKPTRIDNEYWDSEFYFVMDEEFYPDLKWEDEPREIIIRNLYEDQIIKETTHGITNKELKDILSQYPDDAKVVVECCDVKKVKYNKEDNTLRID